MTERKFYVAADTIYHDGRPVLGAFFGRNGKLKELLEKIAALMSAADFEVEPERNPAHTWDDYSFDFFEKRDKVRNALENAAPVFMAEKSTTTIAPSLTLLERMRQTAGAASCMMPEEKPEPVIVRKKEEEPDDPWLKPGTPEYAKWMEEEFKAGGQL